MIKYICDICGQEYAPNEHITCTYKLPTHPGFVWLTVELGVVQTSRTNCTSDGWPVSNCETSNDQVCPECIRKALKEVV